MKTDVIVIGAGPAGSTAANLLAQAGVEVLVLEKARFPRFHIGESLLPCDLPLFERLGYAPKAHLLKRGAEFINERTGQKAEFPFSAGLPGTPEHAWQVERASFDAELIELAKQRGAQVRFEEKVVEVHLNEAAVVTTERAQHSARYVVDATGQDAFFARRQKTVAPIKGFGRGAVFCHFTGLSEQAMEALQATGNIKVLMLEDGWAWVIPLRDKLSVGRVCKSEQLREGLLDELLLQSPLLQRLCAGAQRTESQRIRNFSYLNEKSYGARFCCVGDAACFLDPVFSSGVSLAMLGAERMVDVLVPALKAGREAEPELMAELKAHLRRGYEAFGSFIKAFYNTRMIENLFFYDEPDEKIRQGVISVLAGDVWREDNGFLDMLMRGRRRWRLEAEEA